MPYRPLGFWWKQDSAGTPNLITMKLSGTNTPVGGDICYRNNDNTMSYQVTTSATAATKILHAICLLGQNDYGDFNPLNLTGAFAPDGNTRGLVQIGGYGSRDDQSTGRRTNFMPLDADRWFAVEVDYVAATNHEVKIGRTYGLRRTVGDTTVYPNGEGDIMRYVLDIAAFGTTGGEADAIGANSSVQVMGFWNPDQRLGLTGLPQTIEGIANRRAAVLVRRLNGTPGL